MPPGPEHVPADWYPDPDDPTKVRYWDGHRWTEQVAARDRLVTPDIEGPPPHGTESERTTSAGGAGRPTGPVTSRSRLVAVALLATPVLGFFLPFLGPWASAGAAVLAVGRAGPVLWTGRGWPHSRRSAAMVGWAALWLLPFVNLLARLGQFGHIELQYLPGEAGWLLMPLAGPADPWTPAAVALVVYAVGALLSAWRGRPWPWVAGGFAASLGYDLTMVIAAIPTIS